MGRENCAKERIIRKLSIMAEETKNEKKII